MYYEIQGVSIEPKYHPLLSQGVSVPVSLSGTDTIYVNAAQYRRYKHAVDKKKKSFKVKFSKRQIHKNSLSGSGIFGDIWNAIKSVPKYINKGLKSDVGKKITNALLETVGAVHPSLATYTNLAKDLKQKAGYGLVEDINSQMASMAEKIVKPVRSRVGTKRGGKGKGIRAVGKGNGIRVV